MGRVSLLIRRLQARVLPGAPNLQATGLKSVGLLAELAYPIPMIGAGEALSMPILKTSRCGVTPLGGSGAAAPSGALRAIDSTARPRLLADLRSAPPTAGNLKPALVTTQGGTA